MKTDGLAVQLELHQTSSPFAVRRLTEVLRDHLGVGRERYIQKLRHDIDNAVFERDKSELKLRQLKIAMAERQRTVTKESRNLQHAKDALISRITDLQSEEPQIIAKYERSIQNREKRIRRSKLLLTKIRHNLESFSSDLTDLRAEVSLQSLSMTRLVRTNFNRVKTEVSRELEQHGHIIHDRSRKTVESKLSDASRCQNRSSELRKALSALTHYVNQLAAAASIQTRMAESADFNSVFKEILVAEEETAIKHHIQEAGDHMGISTQPHLYVQSVKDHYDKALKAKEEELDRIIAHARKRRLKLQAQLDIAVGKIKSMQGSHLSGEDLIGELETSTDDLAASTRRLDITMRQLRRELGKN
jgi:uncharacterized phage infection (PIP) family protein YhgE